MFHPVAAQIAFHMALLKKWLDHCGASYGIEDLVALSVREMIEDSESLSKCLASTGQVWPVTLGKIKILKSLNCRLLSPGLLEYVNFF